MVEFCICLGGLYIRPCENIDLENYIGEIYERSGNICAYTILHAKMLLL